MNILTIGGATQDIFIKFEGAEMLDRQGTHGPESFLLLPEGKKVDVDDVNYFTGGGATNSAVSFIRLGMPTQAFFKIGNDYQGNFIMGILKKEGVSLDYALQQDGVKTSVSFIMPTPSGDRIALVFRGAARTITQQELPLEALKSVDATYITSLSGNAMPLLLPITLAAKTAKIKVAVNPGTNQLKLGADIIYKALPNIDILILNRFEAALFMASLANMNNTMSTIPLKSSKATPKLLREPIKYENVSFTLPEFFNQVLSRGTSTAVVTNGSEGVYVGTKEQILFHPSLPVKITSTLGAGDAFGSTFFASLLQGKSVEDATRCGIINSASVIGFADTKSGLLKKDELEKRLGELDTKLLQKFKA